MDTAWQDQAACQKVYGEDGSELTAFEKAEMFYPPEGMRTGKVPLNAPARKICVFCTVKSNCLEYALRHNEIGIWGGMDDYQRQEEIKRRKCEEMRCT